MYIAKKDGNELDDVYILTLQKNIENLGYIFSKEVTDVIKTFSINELKDFYIQLTEDLKIIVGAHMKYKPMYPNFPQQVMKAKDEELYINAMFHYLGDWIGTRILPKYEKKKRDALKDAVELKTINLGSIDDFQLLFTRLVGSKTSISDTDKEDIGWFIKEYKDEIAHLLPKEIFLKENIAVVGKYLLEYTTLAEDFLKKNMKTSTDILRFITILSDGDVSLAESTKFKNLSKKNRRLLLGLLENCNALTEDMLRYKEQWKRVGEKLHPFEYKKRYPKSYDAFDVIRNNKPFETFNGKVEKLILEKDIKSLIALLKSRPGYFARRLDNLLRLSSKPKDVIESFSKIVNEISSPVLLQLLTHFQNRNQNKDMRVFFPKGNVAKVRAIENSLPKMDETVRQNVVNICKAALVERFKKLKPLGKVYLDKELKKYMVPFALRSTSKALKTLGRGSELSLPKGNTLRFFIWWKDGKDRTDIDLSAVALDKNHFFKTTIAYFNLRELGGYYSGDITSAPNGASEFIDINIDTFLESNIRYILMYINSYTQQPFCDLPECFAGFMVRQDANSGEIYEPRTVENKIDISTNTKMCMPLIIDLEKRKVIWTDIALAHRPSYSNNVYNNLSSISLMSRAMTSMVKPSLYELFQLHLEARGQKAETKKEADTIFSVKEGITPFDTEQIIAEFL